MVAMSSFQSVGPIPPSERRLMIFVDCSNLYFATNNLLGPQARVDYSRLIDLLVATIREKHPNLRLVRTYVYTCPPDQKANFQQYGAHQKWLSALRGKISNIEVRLGRLKRVAGGFTEKGIDVHVAVDMLTRAFQNHYDIAALVSGDSDYVPVVKTLREAIPGDREIVNAFVTGSGSRELMDCCDWRIELTRDWLQKVLMP